MSSRDDESASGRLKLNGKSYQAQRDAEQYNVDEDNENDQFETENVYIGPKATSSGTGLKARKESIGPLATSSGPRRMSTTARRDSVNPNTPQFLTVSSTFTTRSRSRSPSPLDSLRLRGARHSIDVRTLPSYLARKRQSISFGTKNILGNLVEVATSPFEPRSPLDKEPIFEEPEAPLLSLQERVAWLVDSSPEFGTVKWIGRMPQVSSTWTVGVEFDNAIGNSDGIYRSRRYFQAKENYAKFLPLASLTKVDNYIGRPRSGTLLSRMSVQLKPGQLISVQRTPSINHLVHCALNAPHHVDHDVHGTNMDHCLCNNCNHPCAHLCKTAKPKGKKDDVAHMCHFSHKPHNKLCCGGEDLLFEEVINGSKAPLTNGNLSGSVKPIDDNLNPGHRQQQWRKVSRDHKGSEARSRKLSSNTYSAQSRRTSSAPNGSARAVGQQRRPREDREAKEEKREERSVSPKPAFRKRSGSDLSISSLPSTSSPVEVYIARGALTDESDMEGDDHHHHHSHQAHRGPDHHDSNPHHRGHRRYSDEMADSTIGVSGGLRSLVQCLVPGMSSRKKYAHHNKVSCSSGRRKKHFRPYTNSSCSSRSGTPHSREYRRRGLSVTPEPSLNYRRELNNSPCEEISELKAGAHLELLPDGSTEQFPDSPIHEPVELNDNHHPGNHSLQQGAFVRAPKETSPPLPKSPPVGHLDQVNTSANSNNNRDSATQTSIASRDSYSPAQESASGHSVTTKAEIETRSPSAHSSNMSSLLTPGGRSRWRKSKAPLPPPLSPCSHNGSLSSTSVTSPVSTSVSPGTTSTSLSRSKRKSLKSKPAPTPPPLKASLTRSMSEQKQLNVKNALNAVPSFRSEVDLQAASKHSSDTITMDEESLIISYSDLLPEVDYEECVTSANKVKVPNQCSEQCSEQASFTLDTKAQSEDGEDKNEEQKSEQETDSDDESDSDEASLSDETIQLEAGTTPSLGHDLEPPLVCKACGHCLLSNKGTSLNSNMHLSGHGVVGGADKKSACEYQVKLPELPVKTFSAISVFGCEMKPRAARPLPLRLPTQAPRRTLSTPLPAIPVLHGAHYGGDEDDDDMYHNDNVYEDIEFTEVSRNLEALLSPQHQLHVVRKENENVHANKGTSVANSEQVIEFINALALDDVTSKIKLTPPHGALASSVSAPARPAPLLAASVSSTQKQPTEQLVPIIAASTTDPGFK